MTEPAFVFLAEEGETPGARIARCAREILRDGPMGCHVRGAHYREVISCGLSPALAPPFAAGDIGTIKTSCGIFVRAVLHWSGLRATKPGKVGGALVGGWVPMMFTHPAWVWAKDAQPEPGAIFYRDYGVGGAKWAPTASGHVGLFVEHVEGSIWTTAEGGGSPQPDEIAGLTTAQIKATNGTYCRISRAPKEVRAKDSLNRGLIGWWRPDLIGLEP
jgi:hypothetical protein